MRSTLRGGSRALSGVCARSYVVERWSLRAVPAPPRRDRDHALQYTFVLVRAHPETAAHAGSFPLALRHPDAAEREAWAEYVRERAEHVVDVAALVRSGWRGELVWMEREEEGGWEERRDSGYAEGEAERGDVSEKGSAEGVLEAVESGWESTA